MDCTRRGERSSLIDYSGTSSVRVSCRAHVHCAGYSMTVCKVESTHTCVHVQGVCWHFNFCSLALNLCLHSPYPQSLFEGLDDADDIHLLTYLNDELPSQLLSSMLDP